MTAVFWDSKSVLQRFNAVLDDLLDRFDDCQFNQRQRISTTKLVRKPVWYRAEGEVNIAFLPPETHHAGVLVPSVHVRVYHPSLVRPIKQIYRQHGLTAEVTDHESFGKTDLDAELVPTVKIASAIVENRSGKYLLVQEGKQDYQRLWKPPSGRVKPQEGPESAIEREVREETGYRVRIIHPLGHYLQRGFRGDLLECFDYHARVVGGEAMPRQREIMDVKWVKRDELEQVGRNCPPHHHYRRQIRDFLEMRLN